MSRPGSTTARGYGAQHQALRKQLLAELRANPGQPCWRCGQPMYPDQALDLGHDDHDRTQYRGLEHRGPCNRAAGARKGNRMRGLRRATRQLAQRQAVTYTDPEW